MTYLDIYLLLISWYILPIEFVQQSEMGRVVCARRAHTTQRVSAIDILTTDLGALYQPFLMSNRPGACVSHSAPE